MCLAIAFLGDRPPTADDVVRPTCPTYPWPTFAVSAMVFISCMPTHAIKLFLTDLLFSSPRLRFSEQQKKAVLNWATQLGAQDVPTYHALSRFQENIKNTVGNSVISVTTGSGHKVYMQDIPHLVAKVRLTPSRIDLDPAGMLRTMRIPSLGLPSGTTPLTVKGLLHKYFMGQKCLLTCRPTL